MSWGKKSGKGDTLAEILEGGVIAAHDEETGALVQVNESYCNLYVAVGDGQWQCTDCTANGEWRDERPRSLIDWQERGKEMLDQWLHRVCPVCEGERELQDDDTWRCFECEPRELEDMVQDFKKAVRDE